MGDTAADRTGKRAEVSKMTNPWLDIPLADYERHMALPDVAQAAFLADLFERALGHGSPESVAVLGCAGGNGFERIDPHVTSRVVGVDINPTYIAAAQERYQQRLPGLELIVADLQRDELYNVPPVDLVFAALLFEYVDTDFVLKTVHHLLKPTGRLVTVLQLSQTDAPIVTPSPFVRLQSLSSCLRLVPPEFLRERAVTHGLVEVASERLTAHGGKSFQLQIFAIAPSGDAASWTLTLREATNSDIDRLAKWNHQLIRDEGHRNSMTMPQLAERMRGWLGQDYRAIVFEIEGTPVAYALFREQLGEIHLRQLFVARARRR